MMYHIPKQNVMSSCLISIFDFMIERSSMNMDC